MPFIIYLARRCDCIDHPGQRSMHADPTPRWGGLALTVGMVPALFFLEIDRQVISFVIAILILIVIGGIDDCKRLGWRTKLFAILLSITTFVFLGGVSIRNLGFYGLDLNVRLGWASIPFTYFCIVGVTNAINLIDGLNGLAGGISFMAFVFLGIGGMMSGEPVLGFICFSFAGALLGFLFYNFPKARIFMGDSGSLLIGFSLASLSILLTQGNNHIHAVGPIITEVDLYKAALSEEFALQPMFPVLILFVPIFDTLRVITVRLLLRKNPFHPDRSHLHHLFIKSGFCPITTVVALWTVTFLCGVVALLLIKQSSVPYLGIVLGLSLFVSWLADALGRKRKDQQKQLKEAKDT